jgi:hypothetical protein
MLGVDLNGYGKEAINALGTRLANQFLLPTSDSPRILLRVEASDGSGQTEYVPVTKSIAFGNLADVVMNFPDVSVRPPELAVPLESVSIQAKGLPGDVYIHTPTRTEMVVEPRSTSRGERTKEFRLSSRVGSEFTRASTRKPPRPMTNGSRRTAITIRRRSGYMSEENSPVTDC